MKMGKNVRFYFLQECSGLTNSDLSIILEISHDIYLQYVELESIIVVTIAVRMLFIVLPSDVCLQHTEL